MTILSPSLDNLKLCAEALKSDHLVGMPTETVYGIAANIQSESALNHIFKLKGRPADNPLIVHVSGLEQAEALTTDFNLWAQALTQFWPGPLTLVLNKRSEVSNTLTGGIETVGIRMPDHPVALSLIQEIGIPLAAPSANRFMKLSPTKATDIDPLIAKGLFAILDGGPGIVGVESTVVDCSSNHPRLLRPGGISRAELECALGTELLGKDEIRRSPGAYHRHYAPGIPLRIVDRLEADEAGLVFESSQNEFQIQLPADAISYAARLYSALHELEAKPILEILVQAPPRSPEWEAVWDRLTKASGKI